MLLIVSSLTAWSDNDNSCEQSDNSITGSNQATVQFSSQSVNVGDTLTLNYDLVPQAVQARSRLRN